MSPINNLALEILKTNKKRYEAIIANLKELKLSYDTYQSNLDHVNKEIKRIEEEE